jgi:hypothetical protein
MFRLGPSISISSCLAHADRRSIEESVTEKRERKKSIPKCRGIEKQKEFNLGPSRNSCIAAYPSYLKPKAKNKGNKNKTKRKKKKSRRKSEPSESHRVRVLYPFESTQNTLSGASPLYGNKLEQRPS